MWGFDSWSEVRRDACECDALKQAGCSSISRLNLGALWWFHGCVWGSLWRIHWLTAHWCMLCWTQAWDEIHEESEEAWLLSGPIPPARGPIVAHAPLWPSLQAAVPPGGLVPLWGRLPQGSELSKPDLGTWCNLSLLTPKAPPNDPLWIYLIAVAFLGKMFPLKKTCFPSNTKAVMGEWVGKNIQNIIDGT